MTAEANTAIAQALGENPKDRIGILKPQVHLVPPSAILYMALGFEDGAKKYGPYNWRENAVKSTVYVGAAMRHLMSYFDREDEASDSHKPHLAHALACLAILVDATETGNLVDDRPAAGCAGPLIDRLTKKAPPAHPAAGVAMEPGASVQ
jgi:hypothetical protein